MDDAALPGNSLSKTARQFGISPSLLFQWKRSMDDATIQSLKKNERVVPESELKKAEQRIRDLERALGRATLKGDILEEAVRIAREKKLISHAPLRSWGDGK
jgi:transposase